VQASDERAAFVARHGYTYLREGLVSKAQACCQSDRLNLLFLYMNSLYTASETLRYTQAASTPRHTFMFIPVISTSRHIPDSSIMSDNQAKASGTPARPDAYNHNSMLNDRKKDCET
jgi:hypothetical protein